MKSIKTAIKDISDLYSIIAICIILALIVFKIPVLSLPYFWDEAWSYVPAISRLYRHGPSMSPDALPPEIYRGHPLLFYFLASTWMTVFGASFISMHGFALIISCITLWIIYFITRKLISPLAGLMAMVFFMLQPVFLGQATFVLPEMLVTLLCLLSLFCFIKEKWIGYVISATLLLYTKESGFVLTGAIGITALLQMIFGHAPLISFSNCKKLVAVTLPVVLVLIFFLFQKKIQGWYFFPEHMGMISHDWNEIKNKFWLCFDIIFKHQKRIYISLLSLVTFLIYVFINDSNENRQAIQKRKWFVFTCCLFMAMYLVFCAVNFFAVRYLLCITAFWSILVTMLLERAFKKWKLFLASIVILACVAFISESAGYEKDENYKVSAEFNLGFEDAVKVQKDMCDFLQTEEFYQKKIYGTFLFLIYLTNPDAGYLKRAPDFLSMTGGAPCQADYIIYSSIENEVAFKEYSKVCKVMLVKRFERGYSWVELYKRNKTDESNAGQ